MSGLNKVVWAEGVFLGQQHFQAFDRYYNERIAFNLGAHHSYYWGLITLEWNESALREGRFELQKLQCVLPNGLAIDYKAGQDSISLDLSESTSSELVVSVVLPNNPLVEGVAGYQNSGRIGGWIAGYHELTDDNDTARTREVMLAKPNISLRVDSQIQEHSQCLRLIKLKKQYDGQYKAVQDILPACIHIGATPALRGLARSVFDMLSTLVRDFSKERIKIGDVSSYTTAELADFLLHKELSSALPEIGHISAHSSNHPVQFYLALAKLHQVVATFQKPELLGGVPEYNHDQLEDVLPPMVDDIRNMIASKKDRPEASMILKALSPGRYESSEMPRHVLEKYDFYLAVDAKQNGVDWVNRFTALCKIAATEQLETIVASGLPGIPAIHVQRLPQKIRIKSGYEYFKLATENEMWDSVLKSQKFSVFCIGEFADSDIELIAVEDN